MYLDLRSNERIGRLESPWTKTRTRKSVEEMSGAGGLRMLEEASEGLRWSVRTERGRPST